MATAEIELVEISLDEKEEFRQVFQEYLRELTVLDNPEMAEGQTVEYPHWEQYWNGTPGRAAYWIVIGGGKVGFVLFRFMAPEEWPTVPPPTQLTELSIYRTFRNRGVGSSVMNFLLQDFRHRDELLVWDCKQNNPRAEKFYDRVLVNFSRQTDRDWTYEKAEFQTDAETMWRYVCGPA